LSHDSIPFVEVGFRPNHVQEKENKLKTSDRPSPLRVVTVGLGGAIGEKPLPMLFPATFGWAV
jgi:hypothetical protein